MEVSSYLNRLHDYSNSDNSNSDNSNSDISNSDNSNSDNSNSDSSNSDNSNSKLKINMFLFLSNIFFIRITKKKL